jgi:hypothetical protein
MRIIVNSMLEIIHAEYSAASNAIIKDFDNTTWNKDRFSLSKNLISASVAVK